MGLLAAALSAAAFDLDLNKALSGASKIAKGSVKMSDKDEVAVGRETASYLCARFGGLVQDPALTRYVALTGQAMARRAGREGIPYHFGILNTDEVNAYAAPGGYIFITRGLLNFLKNESELAGVLAHEVVHVSQRHVAKAVQKGNLLQGGVELASSGREDSEAFKAVNDFTIKLLFNGMDRKDELESDREALALAASAGYTPAGFHRFLERLSQAKSDENRFKALGKSHPPAADRCRLADAEIRKSNWDLARPSGETRFALQTASLKKP